MERAKDYISGSPGSKMLDLGKAAALKDHGFAIDNAYTKKKRGGLSHGKENLSLKNGLIWFAGVSIAEILTGTYFSSLGFGKGPQRF